MWHKGQEVKSLYYKGQKIFEPSSAVDNRMYDPKDDTYYDTVQINGFWVITRNYNYQANGRRHSSSTSGEYLNDGMLYLWQTAVDNAPPGWRMPNEAEWRIIFGLSPSSTGSIPEANWRGMKSNSSRWTSPGTGQDLNLYPSGYYADTPQYYNQRFAFWIAESSQRRFYSTGQTGALSVDNASANRENSVRYIKDT